MNALDTPKTDTHCSPSLGEAPVGGFRLGCACTVHAPTPCPSSPLGPAEASGTLLEVRELWDWRVALLCQEWRQPFTRSAFGGSQSETETEGKREGVDDEMDRAHVKDEAVAAELYHCGSAAGVSSSSRSPSELGPLGRVHGTKTPGGGGRGGRGVVALPFAKRELPPLPQQENSSSRRLYGFVRVKDADHRLSGWYPLERIGLKVVLRNSVAVGGGAYHEGSASSAHSHHNHIRASTVIRHAILSPVYTQITPGMARTQRAERILDYFDERLLRDGKSPTTIRYLIYANKYIFAPWYYAPYGLLHPCYDPMREVPVAAVSGTAGALVAGGLHPAKDFASSAHRNTNSTSMQDRFDGTTTNPYIRDAYLCPFSLRVFPTLSQLKYEIEQYRWQRPREETEKQKLSKGCVSQKRAAVDNASRHLLRPPGLKIYEDPDRGIAMFEVDGSKHVTYARHIFLLGKSFLEKKLAGHDVHNYYFYVVCLHPRFFPEFLVNASSKSANMETTPAIDMEDVWLFAGYFSWEKNVQQCNLACIVTLPCFGVQAHSSVLADQLTPSTSASASFPAHSSASAAPVVPKGLGQFMIRASYELAHRRGHFGGTPERPLSDLGSAAYLRYWCTVILEWWYHRLDSLIDSATTTPPQQDGGALATETTGSSSANPSNGEISAFASASSGFHSRQEDEAESHPVMVDVDADYEAATGEKILRVRVGGVRQTSHESENVGGVRRAAGRYAAALQRQKKRLRQQQLQRRGGTPIVSSDAGGASSPAVPSAAGTASRGAGGRRGRGRRRRRRVESDDSDDDEDDEWDGDEDVDKEDGLGLADWLAAGRRGELEEGDGGGKARRMQYTIQQVAASAGLDPVDALRAVLHAGLLQWSREDRCPMWVLPCSYIRREHQRWIDRRREAMDQACFIPKYLINQGLSYHTPVDYWNDKDADTYF